MSAAEGRIVVISGPSGAGKTTLVKRLFQLCPRLVSSVSATTRPPRPGEVDGVDYHFLTPEEFARRRTAEQFIECFEVFGRGYWYGTLWNEVTPSLAAGKWVVLEIDVQGTLAVRQRYPNAITIFVRPAAIEELERRLKRRATETTEAIERRLAVARHELACADQYQYQVFNEDIEQAVEQICNILAENGV
ncbi:MAG TPA: guanylate kinase [Pirellulales bacterium]|nr:guanylate kinase [Pirellulales bacterium]